MDITHWLRATISTVPRPSAPFLQRAQLRRRPRRGLTVAASTAVLAAILPATGQATASTAISVSLAGSPRAISPTLFGLNGVDTTGPAWSNKHLQAALAEFFGPGVLRYPGGTAANYWSWRAGWFQPGSKWPAEPPQPVDDRISVFTHALQAAADTPVYVLNPVTYNGKIGSNVNNAAMLNSQLQFLHAAAAAGWPVTMVELGNELYLTGATNSGPHHTDYQQRFPTAADYAKQMNPWIAAIHKAFPGAQVAAVAADSNDLPQINQRRVTWNADILPILKGENALIIHENLRVTDPAETPDSLLAFPYTHLQKLKAHELKLFRSDKLPVWVTAFGMTDLTPHHVFDGTWMQGLFVGEQALQFLTIPAVKNLQLNSSVGKAKAAIFDGPDAFGKGGPPTVPFALTAAGTTVSAIQTALHGAATIRPLAFSPQPQLGSTGAPALVGDALTTAAGPDLLLENLSAQPLTLNLAGIYPNGFSATQTSPPSVQTRVTGPSSTTKTTVTGTTNLQLQPYALAQITSN
jgi:hypothetical protein